MPSDLNPVAELHSNPEPASLASNHVKLSNMDAIDAGQFGRHAQAGSLLDQLLFIIHFTASNIESKFADIAELDKQIRSFLEVVIDEIEWKQTPNCVPVALCIR